MKRSFIVRTLLSVFIVYCVLGFASVCSAQTAMPAAVNVRLVTDEAESVLAILAKRKANQPITEADWQRVFSTEGYVRLKKRESSLKRAFEDSDFKTFVLSDQLAQRAPALEETLATWKRADITGAARLALAYLPKEAQINAKIYPVIKPRENSFVFEVKTDPAIFLYLDPAVSREKLENTLAHELHHIGYGSNCPSKKTSDEIAKLPPKTQTVIQLIGAFGEGFAMLAAAGGPDIHPHAVSSAEERARWDGDIANFNDDLKKVERFFLDVYEGRLTEEQIQNIASSFFGVQGPWYTVGWKMSVLIEKTYGRAKLIECICDQQKLPSTYNKAAAKHNRKSHEPLALWSASIVNGIKPVQANQGKSSSQTPSLDEFIANRIKVSEDKTVFVVFALLNVAGYNEENNEQGMHAVRVRIRERLARETPEPLRARLQSFYQEHQIQPINYSYGVVAKLTSGAPDFSFTKEWEELKNHPKFGQLRDLPKLLREFYAAVPIEAIYEDVRDQYVRYAQDYRTAINREVAKVMAYCRVKGPSELTGKGEIEHAVIIPNLLESYWSATSFVLAGVFYSLDGPQTQPGYNPHEFVHSITNPMSYNPRYLKQQRKAQGLFDAARALPVIQKSFKTIDSFFDECLVRAISIKYLDNGDPKRAARLDKDMIEEYRGGYILERFFYEQLGEYERSRKPLREYYPQMLKRLDVKRELDRWKHEAKS